MKIKYILMAIIISLIPMEVEGYSNRIIPGGQSVGIGINSNGIMVVGFYKINGKYNKGTPNIVPGDKILKVNDTAVNTVAELVNAIEKEMKNNAVKLTYSRDGKIKNSTLMLQFKDGTYKTGLYVKDSITGIGTLTYIDPESKIFGSLGHEIVETNTNSLIEVKSGTIFKSYITSIDRSIAGSPGGKNAKFYSNNTYGEIYKNTNTGIYGKYTSELPDNKALEVAKIDEIEKGRATIYTVLNGDKIEEFDIEITNIDKQNEIKNIYFEVKDNYLLEKTGGIVQGMSGSPIIQNNKIIGAVTHVVVSNPRSGYGISIIKMLEDGEK